MFDKLVELFIQFLHLFRFWTVAVEGERTVIYTLGRPTRIAGPRDGWFGTGLHLRAPLGVEADVPTSVREEIWLLANQDMMSSDGVPMRVSAAFRYQVLPEKVIVWQTTLGNEELGLPYALRAAIGETLSRHTWEALMAKEEVSSAVRQEILDRARKVLNRYGYKIYDFWWAERTTGRTYRLITGE